MQKTDSAYTSLLGYHEIQIDCIYMAASQDSVLRNLHFAQTLNMKRIYALKAAKGSYKNRETGRRLLLSPLRAIFFLCKNTISNIFQLLELLIYCYSTGWSDTENFAQKHSFLVRPTWNQGD
jgi:hypothetical protein